MDPAGNYVCFPRWTGAPGCARGSALRAIFFPFSFYLFSPPELTVFSCVEPGIHKTITASPLAAGMPDLNHLLVTCTPIRKTFTYTRHRPHPSPHSLPEPFPEIDTPPRFRFPENGNAKQVRISPLKCIYAPFSTNKFRTDKSLLNITLRFNLIYFQFPESYRPRIRTEHPGLT